MTVARDMRRGSPSTSVDLGPCALKATGAMNNPIVWTFFYGSFINLDVLREVNLAPAHVETARLHGFDIRIRPLANLVRSEQHCVYGILATATHRELGRLYAYAEDRLGGVYLPEAVLTETLDGRLRPALCYIAPAIEPQEATDAYIDRIVGPGKGFGFPDWYIARLESFRPARAEPAIT